MEPKLPKLCLCINEYSLKVTFNYRVGPFGFLTLNTPDYSGNMGLKDQLLALKWVNKNIERFGGDRTQITIFGQSAGGSSANFHVISPASRRLFQRAIVSSGSVLNPWAFTDQNHINVLYNLAAAVYNPVDNNRDLIQMLKQIDANILITLTLQYTYVSGLGRKVIDFMWSPVMERECNLSIQFQYFRGSVQTQLILQIHTPLNRF